MATVWNTSARQICLDNQGVGWSGPGETVRDAHLGHMTVGHWLSGIWPLGNSIEVEEAREWLNKLDKWRYYFTYKQNKASY